MGNDESETKNILHLFMKLSHSIFTSILVSVMSDLQKVVL